MPLDISATYENSLGEAREAWGNYRDTLHQYGRHKQTVSASGIFIEKFLNLVYQYALNHGKPVRLQQIQEEISKDESKKVRLTLWNYGLHSNLDILVKSGIWKHFNGEPLHSITDNDGRIVYASDKFPGVYLSFSGERKSDVIYVPSLKEPDAHITELSSVVLSAGTPVARFNTPGGNTVNTIILGKNLNPVYLKRHVTPLFSEAFQVTDGFFDWHNDTNLRINSAMIGSYFQNVVGIFTVDSENMTAKRAPRIKFDERMKESFLRGALDCKGTLDGGDISIQTKNDFILELVRGHCLDFGFDASEVYPYLQERQHIQVKKIDGNTAFCIGFTGTPAPLGSLVYEKTQEGISEIGDVVDCSQEEYKMPVSLKVDLARDPKGELYVEGQYRLRFTGGQKAIEDIVKRIIPRNPARILQYLRSRRKIPKFDVLAKTLEEFVYENWNGDLESLRESLLREFTIV